MAIAGLPRPADQSALHIARAACATGRRVSKTRARAVCSWLYCGRGAQRYAALKQAIEVLGEEVTDEERAWYDEMKAGMQRGGQSATIARVAAGLTIQNKSAMMDRPSLKTGLQNLGVENGF